MAVKSTVYDIPLIDLQPQFDNPVAEAEIVKQIADACASSGFFAVRGHGIPEKIIEHCWQVSHDFFSLAEAEKLKMKFKKLDISLLVLRKLMWFLTMRFYCKLVNDCS
ncbi:MAG TPA: hypothetical protein DEA86_03815 [Deltaproteobacteria bacterium]|nr:hypothetical protein [Deltaproteobacteria bacterium]